MEDIKFIIFDLDGVFYKDDHCIKGGKEIIKHLKENDIEFCFLTNNSNHSVEFYKNRLTTCKIFIEEERVVTTGVLLQNYIVKNFPTKSSIYVLGSNFLKNSLYGLFDLNDTNPDIIVLGMDENIKLKDISKVINIISDKTKIIASNPDKLIPKKETFGLECGVLIDIIKDVTGKDIKVVGKPDSFAYSYIIEKFSADKKQILMVGDTYETDIIGAKNFGLKTVWVNTGNKLPTSIRDGNFLRIDSLKELVKFL